MSVYLSFIPRTLPFHLSESWVCGGGRSGGRSGGGGGPQWRQELTCTPLPTMEQARCWATYLIVLRWRRRDALAGANRALQRLFLRPAFSAWAVSAHVWPPALVSSSDSLVSSSDEEA